MGFAKGQGHVHWMNDWWLVSAVMPSDISEAVWPLTLFPFNKREH